MWPLPTREAGWWEVAAALWNVVDGSWTTLADGTQVYGSPVTDALARTTVGDDSWTDYVAEARIKIARWAGRGNDSVGFLVRFQDPYNYYILNYNASGPGIPHHEAANGRFTRLAVKPTAALPTGG